MGETYERYDPQHPLPAEIQKLKRDETVCQYCGVSYLIHNEIKALEKKLLAVENELGWYRGCEQRERKLQEQVDAFQMQMSASQQENAELQKTIHVKDALISTLKNDLRTDSVHIENLKSCGQQIEESLVAVQQKNDEHRLRLDAYEKTLPSVLSSLKEIKSSLQDVYQLEKNRDQNYIEDFLGLLSHVRKVSDFEQKEKENLNATINRLEKENSKWVTEAKQLEENLKRQKKEVTNSLQEQVSNLYNASQCQEKYIKDLKSQLESCESKCRSAVIEVQLYKEQLRNKNQEVEDMTLQLRNQNQNIEAMLHRSQNELHEKENELQKVRKDLKDIQKKFFEQQNKEKEMQRKTVEMQEFKEALLKAREEIEGLKLEREQMTIAHQNQIEQLRDSFRLKVSETEHWPKKLEETLEKVQFEHSLELKRVEEKITENFYMELMIEKQKYHELLEKYQENNKDSEEKLKAQVNKVEEEYRKDVTDLHKLLSESKMRGSEVEASLRKEIESLKKIIEDFKNRLAKLNSCDEELVQKLRMQLEETDGNLKQAESALRKLKDDLDQANQELILLQDTVRKECEERFELTESLTAARTELLQLKKPVGGYSTVTRPLSGKMKSLHLSSPDSSSVTSNQLFDDLPYGQQSIQEEVPTPHPPLQSPGKSANVNSGFEKMSKSSGKLRNGTIAENKRRLAAILSWKS